MRGSTMILGWIVNGNFWRIGVFGSLLAALLNCAPAFGQPGNAASPGTLDANQIVAQLVRQNQTRAAKLQHYEGCRHYSLDYTGFPSNKTAEMVVDVQYDAPAQKRFQVLHEGGAHLLLNHVLKELLVSEREALEEQNRTRTALTPENYEFRLEGTDVINGRPQYLMEVAPRSANKFLYRGKIWVDATDFAVSRIAAEPAKNPSIWISHTEIEHEYTKIGEFWLPAHNTSVTKVRFGGTAKLKIDYLNYRVGLAKKSPTPDVCANLAHEVQVSERQ
jgi:hypothetical protein